MRYLLAAVPAIALALSACSTTTDAPTSGDAGSPPTNYRDAVAANVRSTFFDPYSIRDASISQPLYASAVFDGQTPIPRHGWIVCLRANAKNKMGGYIGQEVTAMLFEGDTIVLSIGGPDFQGQVQEECTPAVYSPFPEIEQKGT